MYEELQHGSDEAHQVVLANQTNKDIEMLEGKVEWIIYYSCVLYVLCILHIYAQDIRSWGIARIDILL